MYRLLALAKYDERYVIPPAHAEQAHSLEELATECSLDYEGGPGMGGSGPFGEGSGRADADRGRELPDAARPADLRLPRGARSTSRARVNLLNWDGKGTPPGLFPPRDDGRRRSRRREPQAPAAGAARRTSSRSPGSPLSLLLDYPDERAARPAALTPRRVARAAAGDRGLDPGGRRTPGADAAGELQADVRRHLRQPAALQPLPDLLRARRHPQARCGPAAVQADLPALRLPARRHRAPGPPLRGAGVRRDRRPAARAGPAARPPRRPRAAAPLPA